MQELAQSLITILAEITFGPVSLIAVAVALVAVGCGIVDRATLYLQDAMAVRRRMREAPSVLAPPSSPATRARPAEHLEPLVAMPRDAG